MDSRDHARRRGRIVVAGPLAPFDDGLRWDLAGQGYALDTVTDHVHLLADLSGWLAGRGLTAGDLTGEAAGEFLRGGARRGRDPHQPAALGTGDLDPQRQRQQVMTRARIIHDRAAVAGHPSPPAGVARGTL